MNESTLVGEQQAAFEDRCLVSCGMLHPELTHLVETGFIKPKRVFFTPPGLHAVPDKLEENLVDRLNQAKAVCPDEKVTVVYGSKCYTSTDEPLKRIDTILHDHGEAVVRVQGAYGYDMMASAEDRQRISGGRENKILWFTPGWLRSWKTVYQKYFGWDAADANANFPGFYDKIIVLDTLGIGDTFMAEHPEEVLELFDWTGLEVTFESVTLDRFKRLLVESLSNGNAPPRD